VKVIGGDFFGRHAETIVDNGYSIVAVLPGTKEPRFPKWQTACFLDTDPAFLARHVSKHPGDSIGIACGTKITAIDIDEMDPSLAHQIHHAANEELGDTQLVRFGQFPRRMLVYRTAEPTDTIKGIVSVFGRGAKFVAFGMHPVTEKPYYWPEDNPADTDLESLPAVDRRSINRFLIRIGSLGRGAISVSQSRPPPISSLSRTGLEAMIVRDENGRVTDGREAFLTLLIWEEWQNGHSTVQSVSHRAWMGFVAGADLVRPKGSCKRSRYSIRDAESKAKLMVRKSPVRRSKPCEVAATHLHSFRRPGHWIAERKRHHQADAASRGLQASRLAANQAMLDALPIAAGQCISTVNELTTATGLSISAVKSSRRDLVAAGLWIVERGVYVPMAIANRIGEAELPEPLSDNDNTPMRIAI
jgi:Bifunctional DNA primase/polymerase, N-terminal